MYRKFLHTLTIIYFHFNKVVIYWFVFPEIQGSTDKQRIVDTVTEMLNHSFLDRNYRQEGWNLASVTVIGNQILNTQYWQVSTFFIYLQLSF